MRAIACGTTLAKRSVLASMVQRGIEEPLEGVDTCEARFLLNGFKRCRCAKKLGLDCVPYLSLVREAATGMRPSSASSTTPTWRVCGAPASRR